MFNCYVYFWVATKNIIIDFKVIAEYKLSLHWILIFKYKFTI